MLLCSGCIHSKLDFKLHPDELVWLGERIYENECNQQKECLTSWNSGEEFPSLGIGHFIWYQRGQVSPFEETFPELISHMHEKGAPMPTWINPEDPDSPWIDREQFLSDQNGRQLSELRDFLETTTSLQAEFIVERFSSTIADIMQASTRVPEKELKQKVQTLAAVNPPQGLFAMIDYMHFKGSGLAESERYNSQGWGLLQVLENMPVAENPLEAFVASGRVILENRVSNSPASRNEQQWLEGWYNRLDRYLQEPQF